MIPATEMDLLSADPASLTSYIESHFHELHRRQMPELLRLAQKVERVHASDPGAPTGLAAVLEQMADELESHMQKEEMILFPAIRGGNVLGLHHPIAVMRADHADHVESIEKIRKVTSNLALPEGACQSWTALYLGLSQFIADLEKHVEVENDVLFPKFEGKPHGDGCGCSCQGHD